MRHADEDIAQGENQIAAQGCGSADVHAGVGQADGDIANGNGKTVVQGSGSSKDLHVGVGHAEFLIDPTTQQRIQYWLDYLDPGNIEARVSNIKENTSQSAWSGLLKAMKGEQDAPRSELNMLFCQRVSKPV